MISTVTVSATTALGSPISRPPPGKLFGTVPVFAVTSTDGAALTSTSSSKRWNGDDACGARFVTKIGPVSKARGRVLSLNFAVTWMSARRVSVWLVTRPTTCVPSASAHLEPT